MLGLSGVSSELTRLLGAGRWDRAVSVCRSVTSIQLLAIGAGGSVLIWLSPEIVHAAFGQTYGAAVPPLIVLSCGLISLSAAPYNHLLQIETNGRFNRNATAIGAVILVATGLVGISASGISGAAAARAVTLSLVSGAVLVMALRRWGVRRIPLMNLLAVAALLLMSAGLQLSLDASDLSLGSRALAAFSCLPVVAMVVRDGGEPAVLALGRRARAKWNRSR